MRFAKYYNVTKLVDDMQKKEEIERVKKLIENEGKYEEKDSRDLH